MIGFLLGIFVGGMVMAVALVNDSHEKCLWNICYDLHENKKKIANLKRYINEDEIYQEYKNSGKCESDFDKFCVNHCKDIEYVLGIIDKVLEEYK